MDARLKGIMATLCFLTSAGLLSSCGSSNITQSLTADQRFDLGRTKYYDGDYLEAISDFEIVKLQFAGSSIADSSQYLLSGCRFKRDEFLLAAEEYQALRRNFPTSPLAQNAQFNIAMCYYDLSPRSALDQRYTIRAIDEFQSFIEYYPKNDLVHDAEIKIQELDTRLAKKEYESGQLYLKLEYYKAATFYFNSVVEKYHDSPYAEPALLGKIKSLVLRKKYEDAILDVEKFLEKYPQSQYKAEVEGLKQEIEGRVKSKSAAFSPQMQNNETR